jgi:hypothetical protein
VAIDHHSKWIETRELKSKNMHSVAEAIEKIVISKHGVPERILSDNGLEFVNAVISALKVKHGFLWEYSSPGHHESVGAVERVNQTLLSKLRKLCGFGEREWDRYLQQATLAVNLSFNRSIQTSPFIFKTGRLPNLPVDEALGLGTVTKPQAGLQAIRDAHFQSYATKDIVKGRRSVKEEFIPGDNVLIYKERLGDKLGSKWIQGFAIKNSIPPDAYLVTNGRSQLRLNKSHIKRDFSKGGGKCRSNILNMAATNNP